MRVVGTEGTDTPVVGRSGLYVADGEVETASVDRMGTDDPGMDMSSRCQQ